MNEISKSTHVEYIIGENSCSVHMKHGHADTQKLILIH